MARRLSRVGLRMARCLASSLATFITFAFQGFRLSCAAQLRAWRTHDERFKPDSCRKIEKAIYLIRGEKVMLDSDLAKLYGVTTKRLNEQVKRNRGRFPKDFMFQLTVEEIAALT